ncbi:MAG: ABC transporter permease [Acidimicrobiales bacterium]
MTSYIIRRFVQIVPTVVVGLSFLFLVFFLLPGDPALLIAGGAERNIDQGVLERIEARYGLDDPVPVQFVNYWKRTLQWDLGDSYLSRRSVNDILGEKAVNSMRLATWAVIIEIIVGLGVGIWSAIRRYSLSDRATTILTAAAAAIPAFVLGYILQFNFAVLPGPNYLQWPEWAQLRTSGIGPDSWAFFFIPTGQQWRYVVLPALTLACVSTALITRMTRGSMLEVLRADYMRTARSKGLRERDVVLRHGLRNAMMPVVTLIGLDLATFVGVAVLTETTFSWPGLGSEIVQAVQGRDLPVLLGLTLPVVIAYAMINVIVDVSYAWFNPRVRFGKGPA